MRSRSSRRGVTLIEGMIATVILLVGMVGIFQGMLVASVQNSMANRRTKATGFSSELLTAIDRKGYAWVDAQGCTTTTLPTVLGPSTAQMPYAPNKLATSFTGFSNICYFDLDLAGGANFKALTPSFTGSSTDSSQFRRLVTVYKGANTSDYTGMMYVAVSVEWREGGSTRVVEKLIALYDTTVNQTNIEF